MARKKVSKEPVLKSWAEVDTALLQLIGCDRRITKAELKLTKLTEALKQEAAKEVKDDIDMRKHLVADIEAFATANRADLGKKKSRKLTHGLVGFRQSSRCVIPKGQTDAVAARLEEMGLLDCVKVARTVIKDNLKQQPESTIEQAGARLEVTDEFWCEPNSEDLNHEA